MEQKFIWANQQRKNQPTPSKQLINVDSRSNKFDQCAQLNQLIPPTQLIQTIQAFQPHGLLI